MSKRKNVRWSIVAIFSFFISLFCVSAWFVSNAWFRDREEMINDVDTATIQLENNSQYSMSTVVNLALADQYLLDDDVTFNITEKSSEVYVRCALKFSCTDGAEVAKDMIKFQDYELGENVGYSWQQFGEYFYLCDEAGVPKTIERSQAGDIFTFIKKDKLLLPREALVGQHFTSSDNVVMTVEVEAIQGRNLDDSSNFELNQYYLGQIPTDTYSVVFHNTSGTVLSEQTNIDYGGHAAVPEIDKVLSSQHKTFAYWSTTSTGDGLKVREADESRVFSNISQDMQLWPVYLNDQVTIEVVQTEGGTITPGNTTIDWGTGKTFRVVADSGHEISQIKRDGVVIYDFTGSKLDMFDYQLENVVADTTIQAIFSPVTYDITVITVGNGTVDPGSTTAVFGTSKLFTITPDEGYRIWSINLDGLEETVTASSGKSQSFTISNISSDHILSVKFVRSVLKITTFAGANGSIIPNELDVDYNSFASVSIVPNEGFEIAQIYIDGVAKNQSEISKGGVAQNISFENVQQDHEVRATFSKIRLTISASAATGGSITPSGDTVYDYGASATYVIQPSEGKAIDKIFVDGSEIAITATDGEKQSYTFENINQSHQIYATFKQSFIKLDINGGSGSQPTISYSIDGKKFTLTGTEPTGPNGKEFYYYSTRAYDNERGQLGTRYDLDFEYDIPDLENITTLYAIYLQPTKDLSAYSTYMVFPKGTETLKRIGYDKAVADAEKQSGGGLGAVVAPIIISLLITSQKDNNLVYCTLPAGLTSLEQYAFCGCLSLTGVSVPASLSTISMSAFENTTSLESFDVPYSCTSIDQNVFKNSAIQKINLNKRINSIGAYAFSGSGIKEFKFQSSITSLGKLNIMYGSGSDDGVFENCASLEKLDFSEQSSFLGQTFQGCNALTTVILPQRVTSIPENEFKNCKNLTKVTYTKDDGTTEDKFPSTLKSISEGAFSGCAFTSLLLDNCSGVSIGKSAFAYNAFGELTIDGKISSVAPYAFSFCPNLTKVTWSIENKIPDFCFEYCSLLATLNATNLTTQIGKFAFLECNALSSALIGLKNTSAFTIGEGAFKNCSIASLTIPEGITVIGAEAFYGNKFEELVFPSTLTTLADDSLENCIQLEQFELKTTLTNKITNQAFVGNGGPWYYNNEPFIVGQKGSTATDGICLAGVYSIVPGTPKHVDWEWVEIISNTQIKRYSSSTSGSQPTTTITTETKTIAGAEVGKKYLTKFTPDSDFAETSLELPTAVLDYSGNVHNMSGILSFDTDSTAQTYISNNTPSLVIPDGFNFVGDDCFNNTQGQTLSGITAPTSIKYIGNNAFKGTAIASVYFPNLTHVGSAAFANCENLTSAEFSDSIKQIPDSCFSGSGLTNFVMPQKLLTIGSQAFKNTSLTRIYLPSTLTSIGSSAFEGCSDLQQAQGFSTTKLQQVSERLFADCVALKKIYLPSSIETIGKQAFSGCSTLANFTFGDSLKTINESAFSGCSTLSSLELPKTLETIGNSAFANCSNLKSFTLKNTSISSSNMTAGANAFEGTTSELCVYIQSAVTLDGFNQVFGGAGTAGVDKKFANNAQLLRQNSTTALAYYVSETKVWTQVFTVEVYCANGGQLSISGFATEAQVVAATKTRTFTVLSGTSYTLTITPGEQIEIKSVTINNSAATLTNNSCSGTITADTKIAVLFNESLVILDKNGGEASHKLKDREEETSPTHFTIELGPGDTSDEDYTKSGKPFYFYSTNKNDNESSQTGKRFDVGVTYDISELNGYPNTLYAIYLTPTDSDKFTISNGEISLTSTAKQSDISNLVIPKGVTKIDDYGFSKATTLSEIYDNSNNSILSGIITIPSSVTEIGEGAFAGNSSMSGMFSFPYGLKTLGDAAFAYCKFTSININVMNGGSEIKKFENGLLHTTKGIHQLALGSNSASKQMNISSTTILPYAFAGSAIEEFNDMGVVSNYGAYAFANCTSLSKFTLRNLAKNVTFGENIFSGASAGLKIYTQSDDVDNYIAKLTSACGIPNGAFIYNGLDVGIPYAQFHEGTWHKIYKVTTSCNTEQGGIQITNMSATENDTFTFASYTEAFGGDISGYYRADWVLKVTIGQNEGFTLSQVKINNVVKYNAETNTNSISLTKRGDICEFTIAKNTRTEDWNIEAIFEVREYSISISVDKNLTASLYTGFTEGTASTTHNTYSKVFDHGDTSLKFTSITPKGGYIISSLKYRTSKERNDINWNEISWTNVDLTQFISSLDGNTPVFNKISGYLIKDMLNVDKLTCDIQIQIDAIYAPVILVISNEKLPMGYEYKNNQYSLISGDTALATGFTSITIPTHYDEKDYTNLYYFMNNNKRFDTGISYPKTEFIEKNGLVILDGKSFTPISSGFTISNGKFSLTQKLTTSSSTQELAIPKGVTEIGSNLISSGTIQQYQYSRLTLPKTVTKLSCGAFAMSKIMGSIYFPTNLKTIEEGALTFINGSVTFNQTRIGTGYGFDMHNESNPVNRAYLTSSTTLISADGKTTPAAIPTGVTRLGKYVFAGRTKIGNVWNSPDFIAYTDNDNSVTQYGEWAFFGCTNLTTLTLTKATKIEQSAFKDCTKLNTIDLATTSSLTIEKEAFFNAEALEKVTFGMSSTNLTIGGTTKIFNKANKITVIAQDNGYLTKLKSCGFWSYTQTEQEKDNPYTSMYLAPAPTVLYAIFRNNQWQQVYRYAHSECVGFDFILETNLGFVDNSNNFVADNVLKFTIKPDDSHQIKSIKTYTLNSDNTKGTYQNSLMSTDMMDQDKAGVASQKQEINLTNATYVEIETYDVSYLITIEFEAIGDFNELFDNASLSSVINATVKEGEETLATTTVKNATTHQLHYLATTKGSTINFNFAMKGQNSIFSFVQCVKDDGAAGSVSPKYDIYNTNNSLTHSEIINKQIMLKVYVQVCPISISLNGGTGEVGITLTKNKTNPNGGAYTAEFKETSPLSYGSASFYYFSNDKDALDFSDTRYDAGQQYQFGYPQTSDSRRILYVRYATSNTTNWTSGSSVSYSGTGTSGALLKSDGTLSTNFVVVPKLNGGTIVKGFAGARSLGSSVNYVLLPGSITTISSELFSSNAIQKVQLPSAVESIAAGAFRHMSNLTAFTLNESSASQFSTPNGVLYDINKTTLIAHPQKIALSSSTILSTTTKISDYACEKCDVSAALTLSNITYIGSYAFSDAKLDSVVFDNSLQTIGSYAFMGTGLTSITIPSSVMWIGDDAFSGAPLSEVIFKGAQTGISTTAFQNDSIKCVKLQIDFEDKYLLQNIRKGIWRYGESATDLASTTERASHLLSKGAYFWVAEGSGYIKVEYTKKDSNGIDIEQVLTYRETLQEAVDVIAAYADSYSRSDDEVVKPPIVGTITIYDDLILTESVVVEGNMNITMQGPSNSEVIDDSKGFNITISPDKNFKGLKKGWLDILNLFEEKVLFCVGAEKYHTTLTIGSNIIIDCKNYQGIMPLYIGFDSAHVIAYGNFVLKSGSTITNVNSLAGGITISSRGNMTLDGGVISNFETCTILRGLIELSLINDSGGMEETYRKILSDIVAAPICGDGKFTMLSGIIESCTNYYSGGAVAVSDFSMSGGTITKCKSIYGSGGAIAVGKECSAAIYGGTISFCSAINGGGIFLLSDSGCSILASVNINNCYTTAGNYKNSEGEPYFKDDCIPDRYIQDGGYYTGKDLINAGGGVYVDRERHVMTVSINATISDNTATYGGGIYIKETNYRNEIKATVSGNTATYGGGIYIETASTEMSATGNISSNTATYGGGIYIQKVNKEITIGNISKNTATYGGGVYVKLEAEIFSVGSISENTARYGGGVYAQGNLTISGSETTKLTISKNTCNSPLIDGEYGYGGGIYAQGGLTANNLSITENAIWYGYGGGIYVRGSGGTSLRNTSVVDNIVLLGHGGGIYCDYPSSFGAGVGCQITGNAAASGEDVYINKVKSNGSPLRRFGLSCEFDTIYINDSYGVEIKGVTYGSEEQHYTGEIQYSDVSS